MIYEWVLVFCHEEDERFPRPFVRRDTPILSDALTQGRAHTLRWASRQIEREYLKVALAKCKVIGYHFSHEFDLVLLTNSISTKHFHQVTKYELVIDFSDDNISLERNNRQIESEVNTAVHCLSGLKELTLRLAWDNVDSMLKLDKDQVYTSSRFMKFRPEKSGNIKIVRKIVTIGFWDAQSEDYYAHQVFEYAERIDRLSARTGELKEFCSMTRDLQFWLVQTHLCFSYTLTCIHRKYVQDIDQACQGLYLYIEPDLSFKRLYANIKAAYNEWLVAGKPAAEDAPEVRLCKALDDMDMNTPESHAAMRRLARSISEYVEFSL